MEYIPLINKALCDECGICVELCPTSVFRANGGVVVADAGECIGCGACVPLCPREAITLIIDP